MDVTVGGERFDRHYRKLKLALRLMSHRARAQIVSDMSGLTPDQLVTLKERWLPDVEEGFRGSSPSSFQSFFKSAAGAGQAAIFAGIFRIVGLPSTNPGLEAGEHLSDAYEIYQAWAPESTLEFDYALLLAMGTIRGDEIELSNCVGCGAALLIDKMGATRWKCAWCRKKREGRRLL